MSDKTISSNHKTECKKVQNTLSYGRKIKFSAILKITAILKTCAKNFATFLKLKALIFIQNLAKNKI
jgi:hypothetical protein